jgi:hypothetical protein
VVAGVLDRTTSHGFWLSRVLNAVPKSVTTWAGTGATIAPLIVQPVFVIARPVVPTSPLMVDVVQVNVPDVGMAFVARAVKLPAAPSDGAVAPDAGKGSYRSAASPAPIKRLRYVPVPLIGDLLPFWG